MLDLGVGTGRELSALQDAGYAPVGLDASPAMLALCARRARPVPLVQADLWGALPFDDAAFDAAIALHGTLAHAPDAGLHACASRASLRGWCKQMVARSVAEVPSREWLAGIEVVEDGDGRIVRTGPDRVRARGPGGRDGDRGLRAEGRGVARGVRRREGAWDVTCERLGGAETRVVEEAAGVTGSRDEGEEKLRALPSFAPFGRGGPGCSFKSCVVDP